MLRRVGLNELSGAYLPGKHVNFAVMVVPQLYRVVSARFDLYLVLVFRSFIST